MLSRVVEFSDPPSYLLVLGHDDRHERPVTADRHLEGWEKRLVLEAQMGNQFLREEPDGFVEDDVVALARLAGRHHLVQGGLEFREFVDEILVHSDERSEGIVRRFAHRTATTDCRRKSLRLTVRTAPASAGTVRRPGCVR